MGEEEAYALPEFDAARVLEHLRLKARACLWLEAHGYTTDYGALGERLRFINEGKARGSYLRMLNRNVVDVRLRSLYGLLAENYQATALALDMWMRLEGEPEELEAARLLAEAQSALRLSAARARGQPKGTFMVLDSDQQAIFEELRAFAQLSRSYLDYLSLNRLADPAAYEDLRARVLALGERPKARAVAQATTRNFSPPELSR